MYWETFEFQCQHWKRLTRKSFNGIFTAKIYFSKGYFIPPAGETWTKSYGPNYAKLWAFWQKLETIFDNVLTRFWKTFLWLDFFPMLLILLLMLLFINLKPTVLQCSKNCGSLTRITRLKLHQTWQTQSVLKKTKQKQKQKPQNKTKQNRPLP